MTEPDAWGQAVWTLAAHYRITGDKPFAARVYPAIPPHIERLKVELAKDPLGLWPVAGPYDNEMINGHYTGHSFWVLLGLQDAAALAEALGKHDDAAKYQALRNQYLACFKKQLAVVTRTTGGYIPPGLDAPLDGMDWENATGGVYPFRVFGPDNPLVVATVDTVRNYIYQEGITTYEKNALKVKTMMQARGADWSKPLRASEHHYELFNVLQTLLAQGRDREVVADFYSFLVHTGSTQSGFECDVWAWRNRNPHSNYPPHGWCAARYNECLRNMLVREDTPETPAASGQRALARLAPEGKADSRRQRAHRLRADFLPHRFRRRRGRGRHRGRLAAAARRPAFPYPVVPGGCLGTCRRAKRGGGRPRAALAGSDQAPVVEMAMDRASRSQLRARSGLVPGQVLETARGGIAARFRLPLDFPGASQVGSVVETE